MTDAAYRVRIDAERGTWRITKSTLDPRGNLTIRHLRGAASVGIPLPPADVERLLHGKHQVPLEAGATLRADPHQGFALIVLVDIDHSAALVTEMAHQARHRREHGMRGFRPGCASLRDQERRFLDGAIEGCRRLAHAWSISGLGETPGVPELPEWLKGALEDAAAHPLKTCQAIGS